MKHMMLDHEFFFFLKFRFTPDDIRLTE